MDDIREYLANKQEDVEGLIAVRDQQRADNALLRHRISALEKQYEFLRPVFDQEYKTRAVSDDEFTNQQGFEAVLEQIGNKILDIQKLKETASHAINHCLQSVEEPEQLPCSDDRETRNEALDKAVDSGNRNWNAIFEQLISASAKSDKFITVTEYHPPMIIALLQARIAVQHDKDPEKIALAL